jgi:hypothetical protein
MTAEAGAVEAQQHGADLLRAAECGSPADCLAAIDRLLFADLNAVRIVLSTTSVDGDIADEMMDRRLVEYAAKAMSAKLAKSRQKGRGGWWDPGNTSLDELRQMLVEHVVKGDMRDVMILAAMVWAREVAG